MGNEKDKDKNEIDMYSRLSYSTYFYFEMVMP